MQVAIYARVSTSLQEKNDTIESQLEMLKAYVKKQGYKLFPEHIFIDNGVSGGRLDRPALDRLRDQARLGEFEAVVILSPDRLARIYPHQWLLLEELTKHDAPVIFLENPFGDSPQGALLAQMQGTIAEYERSQILERTRRGRLNKARKGEYMPWAYHTYGYRYIPRQAGLPPQVEVFPEQAEVVKDMFRWLIQEQMSTRQIVKRLNALKIPTRTQKKPVWHTATVGGILNNPIYTGRGYFNKTENGAPRKETRGKWVDRKDHHTRQARPKEEWIAVTAPAIISQETFEKAQQQLKCNREKARRYYQPTSRRYLLRTLVRCGHCQLYMNATRQRSTCKRHEYQYYVCTGKDPVRVGREKSCPSKRVRADRLDEVIWNLVRELIEKPQVVLKEYELWQKLQQGHQEAFQEQIDRIKKQSQNLEKQRQRLIDAYQQEVITLKELSSRRSQLEERLKGLEQQRRQVIAQQNASIKWEHLIENIEHFRTLLGKNLDELGFEDRQAVVQLLVEKVIVYPDGNVEIHHILPFEEKPFPENGKKKVVSENFYVLRLEHLAMTARIIIR
ncbi:MAG: recombinase family protein [Calditrichaeota bacterium]|nr:recombinase family protein [Calditrichota bacterium]